MDVDQEAAKVHFEAIESDFEEFEELSDQDCEQTPREAQKISQLFPVSVSQDTRKTTVQENDQDYEPPFIDPVAINKYSIGKMAQALKKVQKLKPINNDGRFIERIYQGRKAYKLDVYREKVDGKVIELERRIKKAQEVGDKRERKRVLKQVLSLKNRLYKRENLKQKHAEIRQRKQQIKGTLEIVQGLVTPELYQQIMAKYMTVTNDPLPETKPVKSHTIKRNQLLCNLHHQK